MTWLRLPSLPRKGEEALETNPEERTRPLGVLPDLGDEETSSLCPRRAQFLLGLPHLFSLPPAWSQQPHQPAMEGSSGARPPAFVPILPRPSDSRAAFHPYAHPSPNDSPRPPPPLQKKKKPVMELPKGTVVMEKSCLRCRVRKGELWCGLGFRRGARGWRV